jgi:hypothetical protein
MRVLSNSPVETHTHSIESNYDDSCKVQLISSKEEEKEEDNHQVGRWEEVKQRVVSLSKKVNLGSIFAPATIAAIIALVIGLITPLRNLIIGTVAPFRVIQDSLTLLGDGAIPAMTLILGGNLLKGMRRSEVRSSEMKNSCIIGVLVARYILLPVSGVLLVRGAYKLDLVTSEPLYQFVLLLQYAVPPAMNLGAWLETNSLKYSYFFQIRYITSFPYFSGTKTQLFGAGESECSVIMLWTYSLAAVSLTVWPTFFMWLVT